MQRNLKQKECTSCIAIQGIVRNNQQMIQEQIKLIRLLSQEKQKITSEHQNLIQENKILRETIKHYQEGRNKTHQSQQTQEGILQTKKENNVLSNKDRKKSTNGPSQVQRQANGPKNQETLINKENLDAYSRLVIQKQRQYTRKRKYSMEQQSHLKQWKKTIQSLGSVTCMKFKQKTSFLSKRCIPHELRQIIWPVLIQNSLVLNNQFYLLLSAKRQEGWIPQEVISQIQRDIVRSFSGRTQYETKPHLREEVTQILQLFHLYRPDVSYVQGMTYPIIILNLVVGQINAFNIFSNLVIGNNFFKKLFMFEENFVKIITRTFDALLLEFYGDIAKKLIEKGVDSQIYLIQWFYTMFSRSLSFDATLKFWDQLLYNGEVVLFRLALGILELVGPYILKTNSEQALGLIQGFGGFGKQYKLLEHVSNSKLSTQKLHRTIEKVQRHLFM